MTYISKDPYRVWEATYANKEPVMAQEVTTLMEHYQGKEVTSYNAMVEQVGATLL